LDRVKEFREKGMTGQCGDLGILAGESIGVQREGNDRAAWRLRDLSWREYGSSERRE
jgi:hypothetical protein